MEVSVAGEVSELRVIVKYMFLLSAWQLNQAAMVVYSTVVLLLSIGWWSTLWLSSWSSDQELLNCRAWLPPALVVKFRSNRS